MEEDEALMSRYCLLIFAIIGLTIIGGCVYMDENNINNASNISNSNFILKTIIRRLEAGESFGTSEIMQYQNDSNIISGLAESMQGRSAEYRSATAEMLVDLGRPEIPAQGSLPARQAPYVNNIEVVGQLVSMLEDPDSNVRNLASEALLEEVPDPIIRNYTAEIIENVRKHPDTDLGALLLGKTGAEAAGRLIRSDPLIRDASLEDTHLALARLGDREAEDSFIQAFKEAARPSELAEAARQLGYLATVRATLTLAQDIRNPGVYVWRMQSERSVRLHIIEGLHLIFLTEEIFFKPFFKPEDDSYYEGIERWITENLGVTWDQPRPPFLYEEDAPILP